MTSLLIWKQYNYCCWVIVWMKMDRSVQARRKLYKPPAEQDHSGNYNKLIIVIVMSVFFIVGQMVGGYISKSISVFSDAFHLITDLIGFVLSFVFIYCSKRKPTEQMSFGYHRFELLGAIGNLFIIWALALFLIYEATNRIIDQVYVQHPNVMLIVATLGLPVNIIMYFVLHTGGSHSHGLMSEECGGEELEEVGTSLCTDVLCENIECLKKLQYQDHCHVKKDNTEQIHKHSSKAIIEECKIVRRDSLEEPKAEKQGSKPLMEESQPSTKQQLQQHQHHHHHHHENMSMKAAVLHALTDIIQSIGLIISSLFIFFLGSDAGQEVTEWNDWHYFDPISTYIFSVIVIASTWPVTKNCYHIIMERTPSGISAPQVRAGIQSISGVMEVHDLHLWDLRPGKTILTAHVVSQTGREREVLMSITDWCREKRIYHSTVQVEEREWRNNEEYISCEHDIH